MNRTLFVQSLGRSGSNMVYRALEKEFGDKVWGGHEYPDQLDSDLPFRVIFLFADPVDIVLSVRKQEFVEGENWVRNHVEHMGGDWAEWPDLFKKDILGLERMFDAYHQPQRFPLLTLRYESLKLRPNRDILNAFVGRPVNLPPWRCRRDLYWRYARDVRESANRTYRPLQEKVGAAAAAQVWPVKEGS